DKDLDDIADDLVERANLETGIRFLSNAYETFLLIASHPRMGWACRLRKLSLAGVRVFRVSPPFGKYLVFYVVQDERIEILRVIHGAMDLEPRLSIEDLD